jgi:hypothetical protein
MEQCGTAPKLWAIEIKAKNRNGGTKWDAMGQELGRRAVCTKPLILLAFPRSGGICPYPHHNGAEAMTREPHTIGWWQGKSNVWPKATRPRDGTTTKKLTTKNGELKVKTAIVAMLLTTAIASPSNAQNQNFWFNPDGTKTPGAERVIARGLPAVGSVRFREIKEPTYQSRTVITSDYGTSVYNYRSYSSR